MSESPRTETRTIPFDAEQRLWHVAANVSEKMRGLEGLPYRSLCGSTQTPHADAPRPFWEVAPMDRCAVCIALWDGAA